jgi:hypothetical protein
VSLRRCPTTTRQSNLPEEPPMSDLTAEQIARLYPYRDADLTKVPASQIRVGDLIACAGPKGSRVYAGNPVVWVAPGGKDSTGGDKTYITYRCLAYDYEMPLGQPESIPVWTVRSDARKDQ